MALLLTWAGTAIVIATMAHLVARRRFADVWPAYLFGLAFAGRVLTLPQTLTSGEVASFHQLVSTLQQLAAIAFTALLVMLFVVRASATRARATWMQTVVALLGTFILSAAGLLPSDSKPSTAALLASSAIVIAGTLFATWSLAVLGRCFGILPEVRGLVVRGPYRLVRHPVYLGEIVGAAGLLLVKPQPLTVALLLSLVGLQYWRTVFEERALVTAFPIEYPSYRASVPRLLPVFHRLTESLGRFSPIRSEVLYPHAR